MSISPRMTSTVTKRIHVVDSHTGGEPTRVVLTGGPDLGFGSMAERAQIFRLEYDGYRAAIVNEPRGSEVLVGAVLCPPVDATCASGIIFFNNVDMLGMCGHGTIGVVTTLAYLGRIKPGVHNFETPVGIVSATLHESGRVTVANVPSFRVAKGVTVTLKDGWQYTGDVAWGGNWFFLVENHGRNLELEFSKELLELSLELRDAVRKAGFPDVDHVELVGPPRLPDADGRNFVLCPGGAYDRSPCGTGTSAKLACLAADGKLNEGETWVQESALGSRFAAHFKWIDQEAGKIAPFITGEAHITAESTLLLNSDDPFCWGIRA